MTCLRCVSWPHNRRSSGDASQQRAPTAASPARPSSPSSSAHRRARCSASRPEAAGSRRLSASVFSTPSRTRVACPTSGSPQTSYGSRRSHPRSLSYRQMGSSPTPEGSGLQAISARVGQVGQRELPFGAVGERRPRGLVGRHAVPFDDVQQRSLPCMLHGSLLACWPAHCLGRPWIAAGRKRQEYEHTYVCGRDAPVRGCSLNFLSDTSSMSRHFFHPDVHNVAHGHSRHGGPA